MQLTHTTYRGEEALSQHHVGHTHHRDSSTLLACQPVLLPHKPPVSCIVFSFSIENISHPAYVPVSCLSNNPRQISFLFRNTINDVR